ncbi:MAG: glycosyltransferase family 2 protein [Elainella sp.]
MKPESVLPSSQLASQFRHIANFSRFWEQAQKAAAELDWEFYLNYYDDLQSLTTPQEAHDHWVLLGQIEGRLPNQAALEKYVQQKRTQLPLDFDLEGYWVLNPDIRARFATHRYGKFKAFEHFLQHGLVEGRPYKNEFDWQFYREFHTDLAHLSTYAEAYDHWLEKGAIEGRFACESQLYIALEQQQEELPSDFNPEIYLLLNPDLQQQFSNARYRNYQATVHFLKTGRTEGRPYCSTRVWPYQLANGEDEQAKTLFSALFNPSQYSQSCGIKSEVTNPLLHFFQSKHLKESIDPDYLARIHREHSQILNEALALYRTALQFQPNTPEIRSRLQALLTQPSDPIWKSPCQRYECVDGEYAQWLLENSPNQDDLTRMSRQVSAFNYKPTISIILPVYNTPQQFLHEVIQSVLAQAYPYWELCIADDRSTQAHVSMILKEYAAQDSRIKLVFRDTNGHISACSNTALSLATGDFVALLDHDDVLTPEALYEVVALLNQHPEADMIYSDEDKLNEHGQVLSPYFKPDWCPDAFLSRMYTCHLGVYRRTLVSRINGFRLGYEGSQDYDLVLRFTEQTDKIFHIPKVLYHWRMHADSTAGSATAKPYAHHAAVKAIEAALERRNEPGEVVKHKYFLGLHIVRYNIQKPDLISIIIPTRNLGVFLERCLASIFSKTTYSNYEVIVIDNGSDELYLQTLLHQWQQREPERFRFYSFDAPFNFSKINNYAVTKAKGNYLLFLNNDVQVITPDWLEGLIEQAQRSSIGAVGALLLYPDNTIQHAGVILGVQGVANHGHRHFPGTAPGYFGNLATLNNYAAVTGACLMCRRHVFEDIGGFNEQLAVAYNDIDLCLKMLQAGYRNIYLPHVKLYHHESKSRGREDTAEKQLRLQQETKLFCELWNQYVENDPYYSLHLTRDAEDYSLRVISNDSTQILKISYPSMQLSLLQDFSIDDIELGKTYSRSLLLRGWIIGKNTFAIGVEVVRNDQVIEFIPVNESRTDVALHYPSKSRSEQCGFRRNLSFKKLLPYDSLTLRAVLANDARADLCTISLRVISSNEN